MVSESTWRKVDSDIVAASKEATRQTTNYARDVMLEWMGLVYQRTDTNFIPWFSGYWTQQWLTMKVGWYRLNAGKEQDPAVDRLAIYLQEQYHGRVLEPVARQIDPDRVMEKAMKFYVWLLGELLRKIPQRYGVPQDQFERRLKGIPAIALGPPPLMSLRSIRSSTASRSTSCRLMGSWSRESARLPAAREPGDRTRTYPRSCGGPARD
ncbi:hypothetical protein ACFSHR_04295 [Azotobacter chroococcum]